METNLILVKWKEFSGMIQKWQERRRESKLKKLEIKNALFIKLLQKRYGFSKDKATLEMNKHYSDIILT